MNNDITEDYCSFEVAKLLKEKGFNIKCEFGYINTEEGHKLRGIVRDWKHAYSTGKPMEKNSELHIDITRPTHALAIKWIRENFNIEVEATCIRFNSPKKKGYQYIIISNDYQSFEQLGDFKSPEEAIEAALLYTLNHLI